MTGAARLAALVTAPLAALALLTGCGSSGTTSVSSATAPSSSPATPGSGSSDASGGGSTEGGNMRIDITVRGNAVSPSGAELSVKPGTPVTLHVVADRAGELHVHSSPEQQVEFAAGTTNVELRFDRPGVVDIEDHDLDKLVVQLRVG